MLSLSSQYGAKSAVTGPNKKAAVTVGIIFDLASLGLVGAVTIMLFGFRLRAAPRVWQAGQ